MNTKLRGIGKTRLIETIDVSQLILRWRNEFDIDVACYFRGIDAVNVLECKESGVIFFDPPVVGDEALYRALEHHDWYYLEDKWEHRFSLRAVRPGMRVLEVGCGRGAFLAKAKQLGAYVYGIELNKAAAEVASQRGINILQCELEKAPPDWIGSFDLLTSFQVVEHVGDPFAFCEALFSLIKPGGELHVAVPNHDSFIQRSKTLLDLPPHHASRWNRRSMSFLGHRLGARYVRVVRSPLEPIHVNLFIGLVGQRLGRLVINRISAPIARSFLNAGMGRLIAGHTIIGIYRR